ncbi:MAG: low molecular weight protein-tyrosine-phosphatase [Candidatus Hydrogenedentota bacterium]
MVSVLFVCMGNICRSPSAEGVFRRLVTDRGLSDEFHIDSCGTISFHTGDAPDPRAQETAHGRGIDISGLQARQYRSSDFKQFDYILAMDHDNLRELQVDCPQEYIDRLHLFCNFAHNHDEVEVPDPYYGGKQGFEQVYDLILDASQGLLAHIQGNTKKQ